MTDQGFAVVSILLIDDDAAFREEVRAGLVRAGYAVTVSPCGNAGVEDFRRNRQDLVITDVVMDDGEGIETMQRLRELAPGLPVIALSGHPSYLETMKRLGATLTLAKPFRMAELLNFVQIAFEDSQQPGQTPAASP